MTSTSNKASRTTGFLRRNLPMGSMAMKEQAYKALVRLMLEFASPVWDLYMVKNTDKLEAVQTRAAHWVVNSHRQTSSINVMYMQLMGQPLQLHRLQTSQAQLTTFFKHHMMVINSNFLPAPNPPQWRRLNPGHRQPTHSTATARNSKNNDKNTLCQTHT